jgi:hypothetical protein
MTTSLPHIMARTERIAKALYEHWVANDVIDDCQSWDDLRGKTQWLERAAAVEAVL